MDEFSMKSYHTEYSCSGDIQKKRGSNACFGAVFRELRAGKHSVNYTIYIYKGLDFAMQDNANNACLLTKKELKSHLKQLQGIVPFEFTIKSTMEHKYPCYVVSLKVEDAVSIQHKYILTWVRYAYEYPYNVFLREAINLRKEPEFRFESVFNLFNLIGGAFDMLRGGHSAAYGSNVGFLERKKLAALIVKKDNLNSIFKNEAGKQAMVSDKDRRSATSLAYWDDKQAFLESRKPVYLERYKIIKQNRK